MTRLMVAAGLAVGALTTDDVQAPPPRPRITGISHIALRISDAERAQRFYGEILGLSARPRSGNAPIVYSVGLRQQVVLEPGLRAGQDERLSHLAFETPDVQAVATYLASRGTQVQQPADRCEGSAIRVTDPDGHALEFVQARWPPESPGPPAERAVSHRLLHGGLIVRDEQAAHHWYRDTLGLSEIWRGGRTDGVTQWVNMRVPDGTDYLEYMLLTAAPDRRQRGVLHHVCLLVPDIQAAWEAVVRRSSESARESLAPPNVGVNGRWQLNLYDPDGTRVELMEPFRIR